MKRNLIPDLNDLMENDIETLTIIDAQKGSQQAWQNLFKWHFEPIYSYCLNLTSGRQDMAEEVTQQVFITAAVKIGSFKSKHGTFRAWLIGIAKNKVKKVILKEKRQKQLQSIERNFQKKEDNLHGTFVHEILAELPAHYRSVLEEKYLKGLKVDEIATASNCTPKAVESLLGRAREKFAQVSKQMKDKNII
ncbi:MAG: RNA polymerase sigma factor [Sedimentisphaerales bacterium]|nr:RNA polymerase sigma factor [Sedimentisphaerales bacterium]